MEGTDNKQIENIRIVVSTKKKTSTVPENNRRKGKLRPRDGS